MTATIEHGTETAYRHGGCRCDACRSGRAARARAYNARKRAERDPAPDPTFEHGTISGYNYRGCRCDACRAAQSEYRRTRRGAGIERHRKPITHGTMAGYDRKCRCDACRHAKRLYSAEWRKRKGLTKSSNALDTTAAAQPAVDVEALLESRARTLGVAIATSPRSEAARDARARRAEVLALLEYIRKAETA